MYLNDGEQAIDPGSGSAKNFPATNIDDSLDENNGSETTFTTPSFQQRRNASLQLMDECRGRGIFLSLNIVLSRQHILASQHVVGEGGQLLRQQVGRRGGELAAEHPQIRRTLWCH